MFNCLHLATSLPRYSEESGKICDLYLLTFSCDVNNKSLSWFYSSTSGRIVNKTFNFGDNQSLTNSYHTHVERQTDDYEIYFVLYYKNNFSNETHENYTMHSSMTVHLPLDYEVSFNLSIQCSTHCGMEEKRASKTFYRAG